MLLNRGPKGFGSTAGGGGGGDAPAWLPSGATSGISFDDGEHYFNDTLSSDLTEILGPYSFEPTGDFDFDPASVSASGMDMTLSSNRPVAKGPLFALLATNDYACRYEVTLNDFDTSLIYLFDTGIGDEGAFGTFTGGIEIYINDNPAKGFICTDWNGLYSEADSALVEPGDNTFAFQLHPTNGTIFAANGEAAVTDNSTAMATYGGLKDVITVGWEWVLTDPGVNDVPIPGKVRGIYFYPTGKNAAEISALSA